MAMWAGTRQAGVGQGDVPDDMYTSAWGGAW